MSQTNEIADPAKRKMAAELFKRTTEAMARQNWDYAIESMRNAVKLVPDNLMYRQTLRGCEERKYNNNGKGATMASLRLVGIRGKIKKAKFQKDWILMDHACEEGLILNPWDSALNFALGESLREQGFGEVAVEQLARAVKFESNNKEYNRTLALLLESRGEYTRAGSCWERIFKLNPLDAEARAKITEMHAKQVIDRGGYEDASSTHNVKKSNTTADKADAPGQSVEADLLRSIRKDSNNKDLYLKLADFYKRDGRLEEAEQQLNSALSLSGGDINIREMIEDVQLDQMRQNVDRAKDVAATHPEDAAAKKQYSEMSIELRHRRIEILSRRVERYPADMRLKMELAMDYFQERKQQLAIPLLQQARSDSRLKGRALLVLGKCFIVDKEYALARRQLDQAKIEIKQPEEPKDYLEAHYFLGIVCEHLKDKEAAIEAYQEVLAMDYNYRDTKQRLERLEAGNAES